MFWLLAFVNAQAFNPYEGSMMMCEAIWGEQSIPFAQKPPFVQVTVTPFTPQISLTVAVFRFEDRHYFLGDSFTAGLVTCTKSKIREGKCTEKDLNRFIFPNNSEFNGPVLNEPILWKGEGSDEVQQRFYVEGNILKRQASSVDSTNSTVIPNNTNLSVTYNVPRDGYYCVLVVENEHDIFQDYKVSLFVNNPFGRLPAIFFPALPYFAAAFTAYSLFGIAWTIVSVVNRKELLPIQNLIGLMVLILVIDNAFNMGFFIDFNNHGFVSRSLLGIMVTLSAARNSFSFFMVLVVSLGYGVVKPSLGKKMWGCIALMVVHFVFGALYLTTSMLSPDANAFYVFLLGLPLSLSVFGFYIWILVAISETTMYLKNKRQTVKLLMYQRLSKILTISMVILIFIFIANMVNVAFRHNPNWVANQWKWRWLLLDGALHTNYFLTFVSIAYLWMPTANNSRLGLQQLDSEDIDDRDFVEMEQHDDEYVLEWAEQNVPKSTGNGFTADKLMNEDVEQLN